MSNEGIEKLNSLIANKANQIVPVKWKKIILNAEVEMGVVSHYYCFYESQSGSLVEFGDVPKKYGVDRNDFKYSQLELTRLIREMNSESAQISQNIWTIMTFVLEQDGQFKIDYSYEKLSETNELDRREQFEKKYLNL